MLRSIFMAVLLGVLLAPNFARAWVHEGEPAPAFTKNMLAGGPPWSTGPTISLSDLAGKVVVIFLLGCT